MSTRMWEGKSAFDFQVAKAIVEIETLHLIDVTLDIAFQNHS